ncbi:hypothetical protein KY344_01875, partial [Candidatus Woesearchaeota archaeon]|nr:hypothetical protein [Candidatus Woesearchaeota archaeon]
DLYNLYYSFELATYSSMYQRKIQLLNKGQNLYLEKKSPEAMVVVKLMNVIQGVFDCIGNMLVLNISKCTATKILEKQD